MAAPTVALAANYHFGVIVPQRRQLVPFQLGLQIEMPLDITEAPLQRREGVIGLYEVVAQHTVRAADAIIIDAPVRGHGREIPAGTSLAKVVVTEGDVRRVLWCDMRENRGWGGDVSYGCLGDLSGKGQLDGFWSAKTSDEFYGLGGDEAIKARGALPTPIPFHIAKPNERPTGLVGYSWCGGDGVSGPPRFEVAASFSGGYWENSETHACPFGAWADPAKTTVIVDKVAIKVAPGPKPKTLSFEVVAGRAPPGRMAHLEPGGAIRSAAEAALQAADEQIMMTENGLLLSPQPARIAAGPVQRGDTLLSIGARHALTGVLTSDVWLGQYTFFHQAAPAGAPSLTAGQPVYAIRVKVGARTQIVWCAPRRSDDGHWKDAACLPKDEIGYVWVEARPAIYAAGLAIPEVLRPYASPPQVARQPVDLPEMTISYVFQGWEKNAPLLEMQADWGDGPQTVGRLTSTPSRGAFLVVVPGGALVLTPGAGLNDANVDYRPGPAAPLDRSKLARGPVLQRLALNDPAAIDRLDTDAACSVGAFAAHERCMQPHQVRP